MDRRLDKRYLTEAVSAMEKRYGAEKTDAIIEDAWRRYAEIVDENADEPKKMYMHTRKRIYPAGAMNGTAADLLLFAEWLAKAPGEETLLFKSPETKERLFKETWCSYGANAALFNGKGLYFPYVGSFLVRRGLPECFIGFLFTQLFRRS